MVSKEKISNFANRIITKLGSIGFRSPIYSK